MNDDFEDICDVVPSEMEAAADARRANESLARVRRMAIGCVLVAVIVSLFVASWRVSSGLALGGALSLLNFRWLAASLKELFDESEISGLRARVRVGAYVWRYFFIAGVVGIAYYFNLVSITATLAGLCSFVVAVFLEALWQLYLSFTNKEEGL